MYKSLASLFVLSSTEGWGDIMWQGIDAVDIDYDPVEYNKIEWAAFFMLFMVVGSLFILNLFVSIVVNTYYSEKEKLFRNDLLTKYQKTWLQIQSICLQEEPEALLTYGGNKLQKFCHSLSMEDTLFDYFILACIVLNAVLMAINWYEAP